MPPMTAHGPMTELEWSLVQAAAADDRDAVTRITAQIDALEYARRARLTSRTALGDAALWYAAAGQPVFPCQVGGKAPLTPHGFADASTDPDRIRAWWGAVPGANIGLRTGVLFDVVDIDAPLGLIRFYERHMDPGDSPPVRAISLTPHGRHLYFDADPTQRNRAGLLPGVDVRATGGYVIAPPSRTPAGDYRWVAGREWTP